MKKTILLVCAFCMLMGCSKSKGVHFCEGVDTEGEGVQCGSKFSTGDLTAVIRTEEPFETESINIEIYRIKDSLKHKTDEIAATVKPEEKQAVLNLSFYQSGTFLVKALKEDSLIAEGTVEIVGQQI